MNIRRRLSLASAAILVTGSLGLTAVHTFAQGPQPPAQSQATITPDAEQVIGPDTDQTEDQIGDQNEADTRAEAPEAADGQDAAPTGAPNITAEQAKATAEAHLNAGAAARVELDDENGILVYSIEIGASDVKVDAMTGSVLGVDSSQD